MNTEIPSSQDIQRRLALLSFGDLRRLSEACKVPFTTLIKISTGETTNPRLDTVRALWPFVRGLSTRPKRVTPLFYVESPRPAAPVPRQPKQRSA